MSILVALNHRTSYKYDRAVTLSPHLVRLRPAPHSRTPIRSYSLRVTPEQHFLNWQQDPHNNYLARFVFPQPAHELSIEVDLVADMTVINPFDFFLEQSAEEFPFSYEPWLEAELKPHLERLPATERFADFLASIPRERQRTVDFLVGLNQRLNHEIKYLIRLDPGVQTPEQTLTQASGSCRDSAWLLVQLLRHMGLAARFVSGYLIQLKADVVPLDGPAGAAQDFTDLHAWTEVYLPGAGWIGLDPTSGLLTGEGHIPLAATPEPSGAAPVTGAVSQAEVEFDFSMSVVRIHEDPRVTKPYTDEQWQAIEALGHRIDSRLERHAVRLTMGGEPTFVSIDDMEGAEWNTEALGADKRRLAGALLRRLRHRFGPGGLLHFGQGKWYPGESLPRWALACHWRRDGVPVWQHDDLIADDQRDYGFGAAEAGRFAAAFARRLGLDEALALPAYEDPWYYVALERRLPANVDPLQVDLDSSEERQRLARILEQGLGAQVGFALPIRRNHMAGGPRWQSGRWFFRPEHMFLLPGDSPLGFRLPLDSLFWAPAEIRQPVLEVDPFAERPPLPDRQELAAQAWERQLRINPAHHNGAQTRVRAPLSVGATASAGGRGGAGGGGNGSGWADPTSSLGLPDPEIEADFAAAAWQRLPWQGGPVGPRAFDPVVRTAICFEPRDGRLHVFMPPVEAAEDYLELVAAVEATAVELGLPVLLEGYPPPYDYRLSHFKVTPDPGVIEVNTQPASSWDELVRNTTTLYDEARHCRLGTEKFMLDGRHTGTGGGNHVILGGPTPAQSPILRRPDLLKSLVSYWQNHPSLSYLFSGLFVGPTSQAPRVDEGRHDSLYELEIANQQIAAGGCVPPWLVDRVYRHLLVDLTGNTHRSEFCIDKLFSPDSAAGRLGLVEFRAFEMPPHARMSLTQQLLLRALVARFWEHPYDEQLVRWGTALNDRWLLPHFVQQDFEDVIADLRRCGIELDATWFAPHFEFRFPKYGDVMQRGIHLELRQAIEPWNVLGEEPAGGGTTRFVDSSVERLQVKVSGLTDPRHVITCNGRKVPLHPTGTVGEYVAGVRYRAWQPPACLHPTIGVHTPLVFDIADTWLDRSLGGCTYHVAHPGGRNHERFPVNSYEAESRRVARFFKFGHTGGRLQVVAEEPNPDFPLTLDLRRSPPARPVRHMT
ncbi:MAG: transglutaminase family protein [Planctomycetaceae bacterium]|nr:transglutaminase family protein [Planctomycetaceae bacterium]